MIHKIINTIGLGILGIDPITAIFVLSMGIKKDRKIKITSFVLSFMLFSVFIGVAISVVFGTTAVEFMKNVTPNDSSPFWAIFEITISIIILFWIFKRYFNKTKEKKDKEEKRIEGTMVKYITTGFVFALTSFTDPTYYAVILLGSETNNFILATLLITIWFLVSQIATLIIYIANELNLLTKVVELIEKIKSKNKNILNNIIYCILVIIAIGLIVDSCFYLFTGTYLF